MKVLVTGSNGQLGSEIRELSASYPQYEFLFTDFPELDITDSKLVLAYFQQFKPDFVINCAAYTAVDKAETDETTAMSINCLGVENLAKACKEINARFIHVSTDYVFDGSQSIPYSETDPVNPIGKYGFTKLKGEEAVLQVAPDAWIVRTSWLYSSYGANFVKTMLRLGNERSELKIVFDQVGSPTYAADLAKFILISLDKPLTKGVEVFHFSNEGVASWYDFARKIMQIANLSCKVLPIKSSEYPSLVKRPNYSVLDKSKIKKALDIEIPHWEDSLTICMNKLLNNSK
jgi:dTDP-4-dehydrorhamnose reductase